MNEKNRILIFDRQQETLDRLTRVLESVGYIVTGTLNDGVAVDLAVSSDYDVLLIGDEVPQSDRRYVATEARKRKPSMSVVVVHGPESVLTQVRQAGIRI